MSHELLSEEIRQSGSQKWSEADNNYCECINKLQATLEDANQKLWLTYLLTDGGEV